MIVSGTALNREGTQIGHETITEETDMRIGSRKAAICHCAPPVETGAWAADRIKAGRGLTDKQQASPCLIQMAGRRLPLRPELSQSRIASLILQNW